MLAPSSHESKAAGKNFFHAFLRRNPTISVQKPEAISINRITAFNREEVAKFYTNLETVMSLFQYMPNQIYNVDETGISTVGPIVATKGKKPIGSVTRWERGKKVTVICYMNAAGGYIPPFFFFPRKRMSQLLSKGGPPCAAYKCFHNEELFYEWIEHFIAY
ncbi:hypothetical protein JTB14_026843 [Gonioctena quinquepunctata]|nr:hypothetical protein JTB14_026843 [Gonioctena quinquepunctata]